MENIIWFFLFIIEVMKYTLAEKIFYKRDVMRKWAGYIGFLVYMCLIQFGKITSVEKSLIMYGVALITTFIMVYQKKIEDFVHILILFIEITCIEGITEKVVAFIGRNKGFLELSNEYQYLITNSLSAIVILAICCGRKRKKKLRKTVRIEYIWFLILWMMISILLMAAGVYVVSEKLTDEKIQNLIIFTNICSYLSVGLTVLFIIYIKNTNQRLQKLLISERQLKEAQKQYYISLLQREEETRKNRHDWNNHLMCLAELAQNENAESTKQYIETLMKQSIHLRETQYDVGNDVLNAILCRYLSELDDDITVKIVGKCKGDINIDAVDLCVIVSNLMQNAVEYLRDSDIESKELLFSIEEGSVYKRISVVNSIDKNVSIQTLETTSKSDKRNHGIGLHNVRETIERNGGKLNINILKGMFKADVIWS